MNRLLLRRLLAAVSLAGPFSGFLLGCAIEARPEFVPPVAPAAWQEQGGNAELNTTWWESFGDPAMTRFVREALAKNADLRLAGARVAQAQALATVERGQELPSVTFAGDLERSRSIFVVTGRPLLATGWQEQLQASYEVDFWGRIRALGDAADATLAASQAARDFAALSVASTAASGYINLRALDERLDLARQALVARESALRFARSRQERGYASKLELAQAESEDRATAQVVLQLELAASRTERALRVLIGEVPGAIERGATLTSIGMPAVPDAGVPSDLVRRRPDIAEAEQQVIASDAELVASKARLLPSLQLSAAFGSAGANVLTRSPFTVWSLGGSVLAPIFNGGTLRAQVRASSSRRDQALIQYERTVLVAFSEVEDQLSAIRLLQQEAVALEAQQVAVKDALRIAHNRYKAGYATYLEELDAQRTLFGVRQSAVQLHADLLVANVNLYRSLGGGWARPQARIKDDLKDRAPADGSRILQ